jgi:hypothetical protein
MTEKLLYTNIRGGLHKKHPSAKWKLGADLAFSRGLSKIAETLIEKAGHRTFRMHTHTPRTLPVRPAATCI